MDAGGFLAGLLVGVLLGLLLGGLLRAAISAAEYRRASREAGLTEEILRRMTDEPARTHTTVGRRR